jgi:hypothetical protein
MGKNNTIINKQAELALSISNNKKSKNEDNKQRQKKFKVIFLYYPILY